MNINIMVSEIAPREIGVLDIVLGIDELEYEWGEPPHELECDWEERMEMRRRWLWECLEGVPPEKPWQLD